MLGIGSDATDGSGGLNDCQGGRGGVHNAVVGDHQEQKREE